MTTRLTPEREAAIRRLIAPGRLPIPEAGAASIHWLLAELDAVREERDELQRRIERDEEPGDPEHGWCAEHPWRLQRNTAGHAHVGVDTQDGADECLACTVGTLEAERDALRRHADAMAAGIGSMLGIEEMYYWEDVAGPLNAYRAEFPAMGGEHTTTEEEKR